MSTGTSETELVRLRNRIEQLERDISGWRESERMLDEYAQRLREAAREAAVDRRKEGDLRNSSPDKVRPFAL